MTSEAVGVISLLIAACGPHLRAGSPSPIPYPRADWRVVTSFLDSAVAAGAAPGAVLGVTYAGSRFVHATGQLGADDPRPVTPKTIYDLASVTKVVGLTTAVMFAVQEGKVDLDAPAQRYLPQFVGAGKEAVTVRLLLAHAGGLPGWRPIFRTARSRSEAVVAVDSVTLESAPGTRDVYSDLGVIVLTQMVEAVYGERLDSLLERRVFLPLGMRSTRYLPPPEWYDRIAPTEMDPWRGRVLRGEVHDENAAVMDGVSGHAGLFSSVEDLLTFAEWLLEADRRRGGQADCPTTHASAPEPSRMQPSACPPVRPSALAEFTRRQNIVPGSSRALGWDTPSEGSSAGRLLSPKSVGHTGFTGTSLWIDLEHRLAIVLLSNRVNPTRDNPRWAPIRARVADLVMTTVSEDVP